MTVRRFSIQNQNKEITGAAIGRGPHKYKWKDMETSPHANVRRHFYRKVIFQ
ncbi:hypothetical protein B398_00395 [Xylella fastidiosa 32]|nr:hypothetical protein B398_00395 [Xylella fastidiosa 32]